MDVTDNEEWLASRRARIIELKQRIRAYYEAEETEESPIAAADLLRSVIQHRNVFGAPTPVSTSVAHNSPPVIQVSPRRSPSRRPASSPPAANRARSVSPMPPGTAPQRDIFSVNTRPDPSAKQARILAAQKEQAREERLRIEAALREARAADPRPSGPMGGNVAPSAQYIAPAPVPARRLTPRAGPASDDDMPPPVAVRSPSRQARSPQPGCHRGPQHAAVGGCDPSNAADRGGRPSGSPVRLHNNPFTPPPAAGQRGRASPVPFGAEAIGDDDSFPLPGSPENVRHPAANPHAPQPQRLGAPALAALRELRSASSPVRLPKPDAPDARRRPHRARDAAAADGPITPQFGPVAAPAGGDARAVQVNALRRGGPIGGARGADLAPVNVDGWRAPAQPAGSGDHQPINGIVGRRIRQGVFRM